MSDSLTKLEDKLNQNITILGTAHDAFLGAIILTESDIPVYVSGLEEWDDIILGRNIEAKGLLKKRTIGPEPVVDADGAISHGIEGLQYVLEDASWSSV